MEEEEIYRILFECKALARRRHALFDLELKRAFQEHIAGNQVKITKATEPKYGESREMH